MMKWSVLSRYLLLATLVRLGSAHAQDLFEFQVSDSDLVPKARWEMDFHLIHVQKGTTRSEGTVLPTDGQTHLAIEITRGFAEEFE